MNLNHDPESDPTISDPLIWSSEISVIDPDKTRGRFIKTTPLKDPCGSSLILRESGSNPACGSNHIAVDYEYEYTEYYPLEPD